MAFSISDFNDLIQLLNSNPQLRDELRRVLFTEEFVNLPQAVQELAKAQQAMAEAIAALSAEVKELAEAQKRTEARVEELASALTETQRVVAELAELYKLLNKDVAMLKGFMLEQRYRLNPGAFFWREYRKLRVLNLADLDRVDEAYARGEFSPKEWKALNKLDLLLLGVTGKGDERREEYLAVEISWVVDVYDVERAHQRAELLRRLGYPVRAAVGGSAILDDAKARAGALGVIIALNSEDDDDGDEEA